MGHGEEMGNRGIVELYCHNLLKSKGEERERENKGERNGWNQERDGKW